MFKVYPVYALHLRQSSRFAVFKAFKLHGKYGKHLHVDQRSLILELWALLWLQPQQRGRSLVMDTTLSHFHHGIVFAGAANL